MVKSGRRLRVRNVAVIGMGVGYTVACLLAHASYRVTGLDLSPEVLRKPRRDRSLERLLGRRGARMKVERNLVLTSEYEAIAPSEVVVVCTSSGDEHQLTLGSVESAVRSSLRVLKGSRRRPFLLVYSTLPVGGSERISEIFAEEDVAIDKTVGYCHMPLMVAQGTIARDLVNPPFLVFGAYSRKTAEKARDFYVRFIRRSALFEGKVPNVFLEPPGVAELAKLTANAFLSTKISFANMIGELSEKMGVDGNKVLSIAGSHPSIGRAMLRPGYSFGGACLPRDLGSLIHTFESSSADPSVLSATRSINEHRLKSPMRAMREAGIEGRVLVLGKTYKAGISDTRGSPGLALVEMLRASGHDVLGYDPNIDKGVDFGRLITTTNAETVVITTAEPIFAELPRLAKGGAVRLVLDYAHVVNPHEFPGHVRVMVAGRGWISENRIS